MRIWTRGVGALAALAQLEGSILAVKFVREATCAFYARAIVYTCANVIP